MAGIRILLLESEAVCYDSTRYFMGKIAEELCNMGHQVKKMILPKGEEEIVLQKEVGRGYAFILTMNSTIPSLRGGNGEYLLDAFQVPVWHYILDHPLYHHDVLVEKLHDFRILCIDYDHAAYVREYYPWIQEVVVLPLAAEVSKKNIPFEERSQRVIFTGTYTDSERLLEKVSKYPEDLKVLFEWTTSYLLEHADGTQQEAVRGYLEKYEKNCSKENFPIIMQMNYMSDMYLRAVLREELLVQVLLHGIDVCVYGHGWGGFQKKWENQSVLGDGELIYKGEVSYNKLPEIFADTQFALNQMPWFKNGLHDRVPLALMNGAVSMTDENAYIAQNFVSGKEVLTYSIENMEEVGERLWQSLGDLDAAARLAQRGQKLAQERFTWKQWVERWIEIYH